MIQIAAGAYPISSSSDCSSVRITYIIVIRELALSREHMLDV